VVYEAWRQQDFEGAILVSHAPKMWKNKGVGF
jgi:hypothetical protein